MNNERARSVTRRRGGRVHHGVRPERSRAGGVAPTRQLWAERTGRAQPPPAGERLAPRDATRRRRSASRPSGLDSLPSLPPPLSLSLSLSLTRALPCRSLFASLMPCRSALPLVQAAAGASRPRKKPHPRPDFYTNPCSKIDPDSLQKCWSPILIFPNRAKGAPFPSSMLASEGVEVEVEVGILACRPSSRNGRSRRRRRRRTGRPSTSSAPSASSASPRPSTS